MIYVECAVSQGPGTLVEHRIMKYYENVSVTGFYASFDAVTTELNGVTIRNECVSPERYQEFLSIHGSERAV